MAASFKRSNKGNFHDNSNIVSIFHGTDAFLLEDELNESQWNQIEQRAEVLRSQYTSGILSDFTLVDKGTYAYLESTDGKPLRVLIDGYLAKVGGNMPSKADSADHRLLFNVNQESGDFNSDNLHYIEFWFEVVNYTQQLRKFGGEDTAVITNKMWDDRIKAETSRRIQLKWRVCCHAWSDFLSNNPGYVHVEGNLYKKESSPTYSANGELINPGITYALVIARNTTITGNPIVLDNCKAKLKDNNIRKELMQDKNVTITDVNNKFESTTLDGALEETKTQVNAVEEAKAELIRQQIHSGVLDYTSVINWQYTNAIGTPRGQIQVPSGGWLAIESNSIALTPFKANINGYIIEVKGYDAFGDQQGISGLRVKLPAPPTFGTRDDLVFLEAWWTIKKPGDPIYKHNGVGNPIERYATTYEKVMEWRIRVEAGVDFSHYPQGFKQYNLLWCGSPTAQGGNTKPLEVGVEITSKSILNTFHEANSYDDPNVPSHLYNDKGLFIAGQGDQTSKDLLKTADGYVYAIPLFRVKRRNNAGYREDNLNGALNIDVVNNEFTVSENTIPETGGIYIVTVNPTANYPNAYDLIRVGQAYSDNGHYGVMDGWAFRVLEKLGNNKIKVQKLKDVNYALNWKPWKLNFNTGYTDFYTLSGKHPGAKFANVIDKDDIIDLRHQVSLTGFNYQKLLEENFDKLLRGELQTKDKPVMKKERFNLVPAPQGLKQELVPVTVVGNDGVARDLVNLLGTDGNCENLGIWFTSGSTISINTNKKLYGSSSIKSSVNNSQGYIYRDYYNVLDPNKYYLVMMDVYVESFYGDGQVSLSVRNVGTHSEKYCVYADKTKLYTWQTIYLKIPANGNLSPSTGFRILCGCVSGSNPPISATVYMDGIRVYEIDQATYDKIDVDPEFTGDKLAQKFPYVSSYPNIVENLLKDNGFVQAGYSYQQGYLLSDTNRITNNSTKVLKVTQYTSYEGAGQLIKVPRGSNVTVSAIKRNDVPTNIRITEVLSETDSRVGQAKPNQRRFVVESLDKNVRKSVTFYNVQTEYVVVTIDGGYITSPQELHVEDITVEVGSTPTCIYVPYGRWFLPHDYASGQVPTNFTRINDHRGVVSDAQISVVKTDIVEALKTPQSHIKVTQATEGQWTAGDTIQITSQEGVITGVLDVDTALTRILETTPVLTRSTVKVSSTNGLNVGDQFIIYCSDMGGYWTNVIGEIVSVDTVNSTITVKRLDNQPFNLTKGDWLFEITASTSAPVVTATGIGGTWSGLGTKQATFTITTPPTNNTDPIKIDYSISYPAGQGISEVPVEVYEASVNGERLVKASDNIVRVKANFEGKVKNSTDLIPHIVKRTSDTSLVNPLLAGELSDGYQQTIYNTISKLDGNSAGHTPDVSNGVMSQVIFSFDLIRLMEDKFGEGFFADCVTTADKVNKLKSVITRITYSWWGYGSSPTGNKATFNIWHVQNSTWIVAGTNTSNSPTKITNNVVSTTEDVAKVIDSNGFVHLLAYADPSDGTTASTIYTDYVELEVEINVAETGYDVLVPENPFPKLSENIYPQNVAFPVDSTDFWIQDNLTVTVVEPGVLKLSNDTGVDKRWPRIHVYFPKKPYTYYTLSFEAKAGTINKMYFETVVSDTTSNIVFNFDLTNDWKKYVVSFQIKDTSNIWTVFGLNYYGVFTPTGSSVYIRNIKIEEGLNPNPIWTPGRKKKTVLNFLGKVAGSTVENRNKLYNKFDTTFGAPSTFANEQAQTAYDNISKQDGTLNMLTTNGTGQYAQELYEFDLSVLGLSLTELKKALRKLSITWVGYGRGDNAGVATYGATVKVWNFETNSWDTSGTNSTNTPSSVVGNMTDMSVEPNRRIGKDQKVYVLVHSTYPAGTGSASELYADYVKLEIELADYVDYVKSNVVKVRKETKEVKLQYPAKSYRSGILDTVELWYKYVPYQGLVPSDVGYATVNGRMLTHLMLAVTSEGTGYPKKSLLYKDGKSPIYSNKSSPVSRFLPLRDPKYLYDLCYHDIRNGEQDPTTFRFLNKAKFQENGDDDVYYPYNPYPTAGQKVSEFSKVSLVGKFYIHRECGVEGIYKGSIGKTDNYANFLAIGYGLFEYNGELYIGVLTTMNYGSKDIWIDSHWLSTLSAADFYKIEGRPLVKEV